MTRRTRIRGLCMAGAVAIAAASCGAEADRSSDRGAAARNSPAESSQSKPADSAQGKPPVAVTVVTASASALTESVDVVGSLAPKFSADIKSEVSGTVTEVYVTQWVPVRKGSRLARLDTTEVEATIHALQAAEEQARVAAARAEREHQRALQLEDYGLITTQELDEARSAREAAEAGVAAARAQIRTAEARRAKSFINAPMDGVVAERHVNPGDRVENIGGSEPMFRIVDNRVLDLTVAVPSSRLAGLRRGQRLEFTTDALPGRTFTGRVMFVNPLVDPASRSVKVVAEVPNAGQTLKGGLFVRGRIVLSTRPNVLQVPREALVNWDTAARTAEVFVVCDAEAQKRSVTTGVVHLGSVEITGGLQAGDQVVVRGGFALRGGERVAVAGEKGR